METSKHRFFVFLDAEVLPNNKLIVIGSADSAFLGLPSSHVHVCWALAAGGRLGVGNDPVYVKTACFEQFPFAELHGDVHMAISNLAESLDAHRKRQQLLHSDLTMTSMYNVLEKLRSGEALTASDNAIHEQGLLSVLKQIHDKLDLAVLEAYGWSDLAALMQIVNGNATAGSDGTPSTRAECWHALDEAILERLVTLNQERTAEEKRGHIRWLRPEFQNPSNQGPATQAELGTDGESDDEEGATATPSSRPWPKSLPEQIRAVADVVITDGRWLSVDEIAGSFKGRGRWKERLPQILETLVAIGRLREKDGTFVA